MRVIAGTAKGIRLKTPKGNEVRPTADKVKEAFFSIIGNQVIEAIFLDLYAGSGAIGIEALSRGADQCFFVEIKKENVKLIQENLSKTGVANHASLIKGDAQNIIPELARDNLKADLVYLDPPYAFTELAEVINAIEQTELLKDNGLLIIEHDFRNRQWINNFNVSGQKKYGDTCLTFIKLPN
ncbi:MAG: 16S rRNA (guanine(966)-N(2))-methyltransferase RsmD [Bacillota bacterium]